MSKDLAIREEVHELIDNISERNLHALLPLLQVLTDQDDDQLTEEERLLLAECKRDIKEHPERFIPWEEVRRS